MTIQSLFRKTTLLATAALALSAGTANAIVIDFLDSGTVFATMTTSGTTTFQLTLASNNNAGAFINDLSMAGPGGTFTDLSNPAVTSASGTYDAGGFTNAGGTYNWFIDFPNANNASRLTAGETASWSIVTTNPNAWTFNLLHINAFDGVNSIKLDGCLRDTICTPPVQVPEPATLFLLSAGMLGLAVTRRRLQKQ
jgi:hypothetical protein